MAIEDDIKEHHKEVKKIEKPINEDDKELQINFYENFKPLKILYDNKLGAFWSCLLFLIILVLFANFLSAYIEGNLIMGIEGDKNIGFFEDPTNWSQTIVFGLMIYFAKRFYDKSSKFFIRLKNVIDFSKYTEEDYKKLIKEKKEFIEGKGKARNWKILFLSVGFFGGIYASFIYQIFFRKTDIWHNYHYPIGFIVYGIYTLIIPILLAYIVWTIASTLISIHHTIQKLHKDDVLILRPLALDNAAGLGILGEISLSLYSTIVWPLVSSAISIYALGWTNIAMITVPPYIIFLIIVFFFPLISAHDAMGKSKNKELKMLAQEYNVVYDKMLHKRKKSEEALSYYDHLSQINQLYERVEKMPVWPFDINTMVKFASTLLGIVLSILANVLTTFVW